MYIHLSTLTSMADTRRGSQLSIMDSNQRETFEQKLDDEYTASPYSQRLSPWYNDFVASTTRESHHDSTMIIKTSILCSKCEQIQAWLAKHWAKLKIVDQAFEHIFNHYDDSRHLKQSSLKGCHLCTLFYNNFDCKIVHSQAVRLADREKALRQVSNGRRVQITAYNKGSSGCVLVPSLIIPGSDSISGETTPLRPASYFLPIQMGNLIASLSSTHVSTASLAATNLAKEWIAECTKFHPKCARPKSSSFPTRLVDVLSLSKAGKVRVVETQSISSDCGIQYVALSYCWGLTPTFKLEESTRVALSSGVAMEVLPRTMQDAITFTRNINLDWLWIDSLCIIQDSQDDWNREALTMRQVYQDSFLTVAALGAASSNEGLFSLRNPLLYSPCFLFQTQRGEQIYGGQDPILGLVSDAWPLHKRGWVMQERVLPARTLNFGPYLIWQCQEKLVDEYNIIARSRYKQGFDLSERFSDMVLGGGTYNMSSTERDEAILEIWTGIASDYTRGILTIATDRLIAISGIISAIQRRTGWENLAGLWKPFLWKQVLWEKAFDAAPESREPTGLQPSWSWTAITGAVIWSNDEPEEGFFLNAVAHIQHTDSITPSPTDMNNSNGPQMALKVSCMPARIDKLSVFNGIARYQADLAEFPLSGKGFFEPDVFIMTRPPELFLPIGAGCWNDESLYIYGLAVSSSTSCEGAFQRVGFFTFIVEKDKDGDNSIDHDYAILQELGMRQDIILV